MNFFFTQNLGDSGGPLWVEENGKGMIWYYICYLSEYEISLFEVKCISHASWLIAKFLDKPTILLDILWEQPLNVYQISFFCYIQYFASVGCFDLVLISV